VLLFGGSRNGQLRSMKRLAVSGAIAFHLSASLFVFFIGHFVSLSQAFPDSARYQTEILIAAQVFRQQGIAAWFFSLLPFHVKLYSLLFAILSRAKEVSLLWFEPLNVVFYLAILALVFIICRRLFDKRAALFATIVVGIWPSFLLHTTQPLRDPMAISLGLLFLAINSVWLVEEPPWKWAVALVALGMITEVFLWLVKSEMWPVTIGIVCLTCALLLVKMALRRSGRAANLLAVLTLLITSVVIPPALSRLDQPARRWAGNRGVANLYYNDTDAAIAPAMMAYVPPRSPLVARTARLRHKFILLYPEAGSNIDTDVEFQSLSDLIRYIPRAAAIGFLAPFPRMWFERGTQNGRTGRIVAGTETAILYLIEALALVGLWRKRRDLLAWWLGLVALGGCLALGLVVTNIGALYRMRYIFVIVLIVLAAEPLRLAVSYLIKATNQRHQA